MTSAADNRGNRTQCTLDAMGNRVREEVKDVSGNIARLTSRVINSLNHVAAVQGSVGQTTALAFDANGELTSATDPLNQSTRQTLDALRRPAATTFADNNTASQAWNALGQLTRVADPRGVATLYQRNAAGDIASMLDARGNTTGYQYDALRRVIQVSQAGGKLQTFSYDGTGAGAQIGQLREFSDSSGSTGYQRDAFGRIASKTQFIADNPGVASNYTTRYAYSGAGEISQISYPSGLKIYYRRNASGQITGIDSQQPGADKPIVPFLSELTYTALGQPRSWRWASGDAAARLFDADGRMAGNEFASYSFDAASRITAITQSLWASADIGSANYKTSYTWRAGYDRRGRITGFSRPGQEASYSYDANGNRLSAAVKTDSGAGLDGEPGPSDTAKTSAQALRVDSASNRLLGFVQTHSLARGSQSLTSATSPVNFSLDASGNLTHDGASGFDYDSANRPSQARIRQGGEAFKIAYLHNALGQRYVYADGALPSYALLGEKWLRLFEQHSPIYEWTPGGSQRCRVVHGGGRRLRRTDRCGTKNLNSAISASFH